VGDLYDGLETLPAWSAWQKSAQNLLDGLDAA
jgi:hypothetical protein